MKYEVVHFFIDLCDDNHTYNVGDKFPRSGMEVSDERIKELSGSSNRQGIPLIKEVTPPVEKVKPKGKTTSKKKKKVEEDAD